MTKPLCEKYRPKRFAEILGQDLAIEKLKTFVKKFPVKKAAVLYGPAGSGKTSLAYALANELNAELLELNASDFRDKQNFERVVKPAIQQASLFGRNKIILIDEIDGLTTQDRGGLPELLSLIEKTNYPIVLTANDVWDRKFSLLRKKAELIELKPLSYRTIFWLLKDIASKEGIKASEDLLKAIAIKARGDARAAINDLQSILETTAVEDIAERDKQEQVFNILRQIFHSKPNNYLLRLMETADISLDELFLWIEKNIPLEYSGDELAKAFEMLSKADIFRGRIIRWQYWRFMVYENIFLSYGIAAAKKTTKKGFVPYKRPSRILKIWLANQKNAIRKSIANKYAAYCHISTKKALRDFYLTAFILASKKIAEKVGLEENEQEFLRELVKTGQRKLR